MLKHNNTHHVNQNKYLNQSHTRIEMWKRLLNSRKAENVLLKSKLADILRNNFDKNLLDEIEDFQTRFITEDELIDSLRREVNELDTLQNTSVLSNEKTEISFHSRMKKISKDIDLSTSRFDKLKSAFDDFRNKLNSHKKKRCKFRKQKFSIFVDSLI